MSDGVSNGDKRFEDLKSLVLQVLATTNETQGRVIRLESKMDSRPCVERGDEIRDLQIASARFEQAMTDRVSSKESESRASVAKIAFLAAAVSAAIQAVGMYFSKT